MKNTHIFRIMDIYEVNLDLYYWPSILIHTPLIAGLLAIL